MPFKTGEVNTSPTGILTSATQFSNFVCFVPSVIDCSFTVRLVLLVPLPEIGPEFPAIFRDTVKLNTLDYKRYEKMQQCIIDVLDIADTVRIDTLLIHSIYHPCLLTWVK